MLSIHHDGTVQDFYDNPAINHIERTYKSSDFLSRKLFLGHLNADVSDEDFERNLENFNKEMHHMRHKWAQAVKP
jgi:hypothetical protein